MHGTPEGEVELYRQIPGVDVVASDPRLAQWPGSLVVPHIRRVVDGIREQIRAGELNQMPDVAALVCAEVASTLGGVCDL